MLEKNLCFASTVAQSKRLPVAKRRILPSPLFPASMKPGAGFFHRRSSYSFNFCSMRNLVHSQDTSARVFENYSKQQTGKVGIGHFRLGEALNNNSHNPHHLNPHPSEGPFLCERTCALALCGSHILGWQKTTQAGWFFEIQYDNCCWPKEQKEIPWNEMRFTGHCVR